VAPVRSRMMEISTELAKQAVDIDKAKAMLPMVLMALSQSVNIPLLMASLNIEPDMVESLTKQLKQYFESGM
jgi:peptidoglycan hydrolase-like protein with peptidoglycan-binding domain